MVYSVQQANNFYLWWFDESVRWYLHLYYWPYYAAGKQDEWAKMGITLNGVRPICRS
jgi:hypothetical protein